MSRLVVMANKGLADHPHHPQPIAGVLVGQPSAADATAVILGAGVPLDFAEATVYELARSHQAEGQVRSLKYFSEGVVRAWTRAQASSAAQQAGAPPSRTAPHAGAPSDDGVWNDAVDLVARLNRREVDATEYAALPPPLRAAFKAVGGWTTLRDARPQDLPFRRRDFLAAYRAAALVPAASSPTRVTA